MTLVIPAAPALKGDRGLSKQLIDLLPEDTAAVLVLDVQRAAKSDIGSSLLKALVAEQRDDDPIRVADVAKDVEQIVVAQFLIDTGAGDFCFLVRLRDGSQLPKTLKALAAKNARDAVPEKIGKRSVYSISGPNGSFAQIDDRTLMLVLAMGDKKQVEETRAAAYGEREQPGPRPALRKMLSDDRSDDCVVRLYGYHPTKLAHSTALVLALFGVLDSDPLVAMGERIVSYRGGIKTGESAEFELRITTRDADTARELLKIYEDPPREDPVVREFRKNATAVREGDDVVLKGKATQAMVERLARDPNK
ncbi:MAG TPA: hypothetical protein VKD71_05385 [Gemmataceae bacterium]|nr:hypothetical protein [Gemmataceae bacterium]